MRGPIDFIVVGFSGHTFDGKILQTLTQALDSGVIGLVGLCLIRKDMEGRVSKYEVADAGDRYITNFVERYSTEPAAIADDDIMEAGELLDNDTAAGLLVIEQLWARPLKVAILEAGGELLAEGRIHPEAAEELSTKER